MSDAALEMELSEAERLEFNRRNDLAYAVIPAAARLFSEGADLEERIKSESKAVNSYWYWIIGGGGLILQFFLSGNTFEFTLGAGTGVALVAAGSWYLRQYEVLRLRSMHDRCNERLYDLEVIWGGATGKSTFRSISDFASGLGFDTKDDVFCDWWEEQRTCILDRVCGYEKGKRIGEDWAKRHAKFRTDLRDFQANL